jgi:hypothetical protein
VVEEKGQHPEHQQVGGSRQQEGIGCGRMAVSPPRDGLDGLDRLQLDLPLRGDRASIPD